MLDTSSTHDRIDTARGNRRLDRGCTGGKLDIPGFPGDVNGLHAHLLSEAKHAGDQPVFGMVIARDYNAHAPPHFHVRFGKQKAVVGIEPVVVLAGRLSPRVRALALEWAALHQAELMADWELARQLAPLNRIDPLE